MHLILNLKSKLQLILHCLQAENYFLLNYVFSSKSFKKTKKPSCFSFVLIEYLKHESFLIV